MTTLAEFMIIAGTDNRPPMLEKSLYDSWKSRMEFYMENRENGRMILDSVQNGPLVWPTVVQEDGLPPDVYAIVNHHKVTKEIWDKVKLLMQGTKLSLQERECKLYDEFDKFTFVKGETLYQYYRRFAQLINNMNVINMSMRPVQVNTKFLNSLIPEWSLVVPVFNQGDDPIACINKAMDFLTAAASSRNVTWFKKKAMLAEAQEAGQILDEEQLAFLTDLVIPDGQVAQTIIPNTDAFCRNPGHFGLAVPVFNQGDDPIAFLNKAMDFLTAVASVRLVPSCCMIFNLEPL
ncbi:hypothetical protein Tco_0878886 [Tanacetum coccineum]|uniref:Integrase, catalytic region, zinc finger, CCHC-type, peptidase aspartic, catalytic n=1 Tax=Tanacetum coccineum TaxID=301880 RepID=A0ABQ5BZH0_9ASTR